MMCNSQTIQNKLVDELESNNTSLSKINRCARLYASSLECRLYCNLSQIKEFYRKYVYKIIFLTVIICYYLTCVPKCESNTIHQHESIAAVVLNEDTHLCRSLQLKIDENDLYGEIDLFVDTSD